MFRILNFGNLDLFRILVIWLLEFVCDLPLGPELGVEGEFRIWCLI